MKQLVIKITGTFFKGTFLLFIVLLVYIFSNSALDVYNNFVYDKAILRPTPYGYTPLIRNPEVYTSIEKEVMSGEYVYVVDWISAYNNSITFAKVKSKFKEGYINRALLVEANFNPKPIASIMLLGLIFTIIGRKIYYKLKDKNCLQQE